MPKVKAFFVPKNQRFVQSCSHDFKILKMEKPELNRSLTFWGLTMIAVGCTIGSGIFRTPGGVADAIHVPEMVLAVWVLGGLAALTGALTLAEMGSMFPGAGGLYVYLREAYGETTGFLYGWFILFVSTSGAIAALMMVCAEHIFFLFGLEKNPKLILALAVGMTIFLTVANIFGVKVGEWIAKIFTGAKLFGLAIIILAGIFWALPDVDAQNAASVWANDRPESMWKAFAIAFVGVMWSYGGWHHASFMAGETPDPQRTVPRAMMTAAAIITTVYVLANFAYLRLLPVEQIAHSQTVAADAMTRVHPWSGKLMAFLIALSTFGSTGIYCMTAPRIYFQMARDGVFFKKMADVHPKYRTPVNAILLQSGWAVFLLFFWGTFDDLMTYVTFIDFIGLMMCGASIFIFRKKMPNHPRGYRTWGYPVVPMIFVGICFWFLTYTLLENPVRAGAGIFVVLVGWVVYLLFFKKKNGGKSDPGILDKFED